MAQKEVVEVVYGKHAKYEILKDKGGLISSPRYYVHKNGEYLASYSSLAVAVQAAKKAG